MPEGLTSAEVRDRISKGQVNVNSSRKTGKSVKDIILSNTMTFFNLLNLAFFVLVVISGSFKNGTFFIVIVINTLIGIVQELRTKKTLDELSILTASHAMAVRDGKLTKITVDEIVLDDVLKMRAGDQIAADAEVLDGEIEVNEAMLTGESDHIAKTKGAQVFSGTFVTSGSAYVRVVHVGAENYTETIQGEAKRFKKVDSELRNSLDRILKIISFFIVPLCAGLFLKSYFLLGVDFQTAVVQMVTSGIGMIPEGLMLLTSVALTLGVLRLAEQRTVVQELYCIETLARVDVLCLDKTGTLTEGRLKVERTQSFIPGEEMEEAFRNVLASQEVTNATGEGILAYFGRTKTPWDVRTVIPFSSDRKYSGASFHGHGAWYMGAAGFLFPENRALLETVESYAAEGFRVIVLGHAEEAPEDASVPEGLEPAGYVVMSDIIRKDCRETLDFFKKQDVALKVISGDDPLTVSRIALRCGLENADRCVDMSRIRTKEEMAAALRENTVFGRVRPEQKRMMVECLQEDGHTVAMTGDGVNDVLAMKQSDCSIAMAAGAEATKHAANIVLLDSNFSSMPSVVMEGRRVINNICSASSMFLIKTTFSVLLSIGTLLAGQMYPFQAVQLTMISACAVGVPTFFLQMEPTFRQVRKDFMRQVFRNAVPAGIIIAVICFMITNIGIAINHENADMMSTMCVLGIGYIYFFMLKRIYSPLTVYRRVVVYTMEVVYLLVMIFTRNMLDLTAVTSTGVLVLLAVITFTPAAIDLLEQLFDKVTAYMDRKALEKAAEEERLTRKKARAAA
ncbi:MAG: HAD-IC family P-type ATPase [Lachnospiraceae bacterium]|nr:HAD-IC family P-type ATPase [Lachnospiraceae bacterium]